MLDTPGVDFLLVVLATRQAAAANKRQKNFFAAERELALASLLEAPMPLMTWIRSQPPSDVVQGDTLTEQIPGLCKLCHIVP